MDTTLPKFKILGSLLRKKTKTKLRTKIRMSPKVIVIATSLVLVVQGKVMDRPQRVS